MPTIRITVLRDDGEPAKGHRVTLGVSGLTGGVTDDVYTDDQGIAEFEVEYGQGEVFVDGQEVDRWGSYSATDITVHL